MHRWKTADPKYYRHLKDEIARLKSNMTECEKILWQELKSKKLGVKFRRQHMVGQFIPDFVCLSIKLIIEVDGEIHKIKKEYDEGRTYQLEELGYKVIRFTNEEIKNNLGKVMEKIKKEIGSLTTKNFQNESQN